MKYIQRKAIDHLQHVGISTWGIAYNLGVPTSKALRVMKSLEKLGAVKKCDRYSSANNYVWVLTDAYRRGEL